MAGELGILAANLKTQAYNDWVNAGTYKTLVDRIDEFNLEGLKGHFKDLTKFYDLAAQFEYQCQLAVEYLRDSGEWWKTVDIADLKTALQSAIAANATTLSKVAQDHYDSLWGQITSIPSDIRWDLWPDFANLENLIRQYSSASMPSIQQALDQARTLINENLSTKLGDTALNISNAQSAILQAVTDKTNDLKGSINGITSTVTAAVTASQMAVTTAITTAEDRIKAGAVALALKTEDLIKGLFGNLQAFFQSAGDDIAYRVFEYFRSFVFDKEGE